MPQKPKRGYRSRSIFKTKETSTDPVLTNQHALFQQEVEFTVRRKSSPVRKTSKSKKKSARNDIKEKSEPRYDANDNVLEKPADKCCSDPGCQLYKGFPAGRFIANVTNKKPVSKTSKSKKKSAKNDIKEKSKPRYDANDNILEKPADIENFFSEGFQQELRSPVRKKLKITKHEKTLINVSPHDVRLKNHSKKRVKNSSDNKKQNTAIKKLESECANLSDAIIEILNQVAESETDVSDNLPKCSDLNMQMKNYCDNLKSLKSEQMKQTIISKEFTYLCGQISGSMLYIEDNFKKLKRPFCCDDHDYSSWCEILKLEIQSMSSLIYLFENKVKHHKTLAGHFLHFLEPTKRKATEVMKQELNQNSINASQSYKNVEDTVQSLISLGALCRIICHVLKKLLVVEKITVCKSYNSWKKINDRLFSNFQEELIVFKDALSQELDLSDLVKQAENCVISHQYAVLSRSGRIN